MIAQCQAMIVRDAVNANLRSAIALHAVYGRAATDIDLLSRLNNSYAANAFNAVRQGLLHAMVAALARLWDGTRDAHSIPTLLEYLRGDNAKREFVKRRRQAMLGLEQRPEMTAKHGVDSEVLSALARISEIDANRAEREARRELSACIEAISAMIADPLVGTLKNFRNKVVAHTLEATRV